MVRIEDDCVGCRDLGLYCMGSSCPNRNVKHFYCDRCKCESEELYDVSGDEVCEDCLPKMFSKKHLVCDVCGGETDELYDVFGDGICEDCFADYFPKITED